MKNECKSTVTRTQWVIRDDRGMGVALAASSTYAAGKNQLAKAKKDRPGEPLRLVREYRTLPDQMYGDD